VVPWGPLVLTVDSAAQRATKESGWREMESGDMVASGVVFSLSPTDTNGAERKSVVNWSKKGRLFGFPSADRA
jgi:hypothetical protein